MVIFPTLFLIYINDLFKAVKNAIPSLCCALCHEKENTVASSDILPSPHEDLVAFADDSNILCAEDTEQALEVKLHMLMERSYHWFDTNRLALNIAKSHFLIFSRTGKACPSLSTISTSKGPLSRPNVRYVRFLGILLDENLSFRNHIKMVQAKISRNLGIIRKLKHIFPGSILRTLYFSLIQPYLTYCNSIWMSTFQSLLHPIKVIHQKARQLVNEFNKGHRKVLLNTYALYVVSCSSMIFKYLHGELPRCFNSFFPDLVNSRSSYNLRNKDHLLLPQTKTVRSDFSPRIACSKVWNSLPDNVRSIHSFDAFKTQLKIFLVDKYNGE